MKKKLSKDTKSYLLNITLSKRIKLATLLSFILFSFLIPIKGYAQGEKINLSLKNSTLKEALKLIEQQTAYVFFYNESEIDVNQKVTVRIANGNIEQTLNTLLTTYQYKIDNRKIAILPGSKTEGKGKAISGTVIDDTGLPVIGANIVVKGTQNGTITDMDGNFSLTVPANSTLKVSYIGYVDQYIPVGNQAILSIKLKEDSQALEEVVVVGYGTQKKVNLTGSVASVSGETLTERPTANVASLLQGQIPGLQVTQNSGQPGSKNTSMQLRGMGTFSSAGTAPMVLVDGVDGSLDALSPNEIESISVLKDAASAAIYGARAANGVILVTTKRGQKGKVQVAYHVNTGWQQATILPELINNSVEYMEMYNTMADRVTGKRKYSADYIDLYRDPNRNKTMYPDYDWIKETFKTGFTHNHSLTASGGTDKILYNINFSYLNQDGILPGHGYERFTGRSNVEAQVHEKIKIGAKVAFYNGNIESPAYQPNPVLLQIAQQRPMYMPYLPDGSGRYTYTDLPLSQAGEFVNRNPLYIANETSSNTEDWRWDAQTYIDVELLKRTNMSLTWNSKAAISYSDSFNKLMEPNDGEGYYYHKQAGQNDHVVGSKFEPSGNSGVKDSYSKEKRLTLFTTLNYNLTVNKHVIGVLAGYNQESFKSRLLKGHRRWFPSYALEELDGGSPLDQKMEGNSAEWGLASFFGRLNYAYDSKYLFEANFRYDGTSRIYADNRWGLFPSFSAAWRISEEKFMKENYSWIDNLKVRASWGKLGNQSIGNYVYHDVYESSNVVIGGEVVQAINQKALTDKTLSWEETSVTGVGVDLNLWNNKLSLVFDWYNKVTNGILNDAPIPASVGLDAPVINYGKLQNRGVEFQIGHANTIQDFTYGLSFMTTLNKNKVLELRAPTYGNYINEVGLPYGEHYMYEWIGLLQSDEDIKSSAKHPYKAQPGDLKYKDQNNDKVIDAKDRVVVSGRHPKMLYSFNLNAGYKNFDVSAFFQGVAGYKIYTHSYVIEPFSQGGAPTVEFRDAWTPENTNTNVPALYNGFSYYNSSNNRSTYFLRDASYLRLKNLQVGYNFSSTFSKKIGLQSLRLYFAGENLLTFTDYPHADPERDGDGQHAVFPQVKTISIGLDVKF